MLQPEDNWYRTDNTDYFNLPLKGRFTDDSVLTLAVADAILTHKKTGEPLEKLVIQKMQAAGKAFAHRGFSHLFFDWIFKSDPQPYESWGNGAAMRISPCGWLADTYEQALKWAEIITNVTHNTPDALWGAKFVTSAIFYMKSTNDEFTKLFTKAQLCKEYNLDYDKIENAPFQRNCKQAVSLAFKAFCESNSFNETIHKAISYGGDTDTIAAIAGSIAEACYPIDTTLIEQARNFFSKEGELEDWEEPAVDEFFAAFKDWTKEIEGERQIIVVTHKGMFFAKKKHKLLGRRD